MPAAATRSAAGQQTSRFLKPLSLIEGPSRRQRPSLTGKHVSIDRGPPGHSELQLPRLRVHATARFPAAPDGPCARRTRAACPDPPDRRSARVFRERREGGAGEGKSSGHRVPHSGGVSPAGAAGAAEPGRGTRRSAAADGPEESERTARRRPDEGRGLRLVAGHQTVAPRLGRDARQRLEGRPLGVQAEIALLQGELLLAERLDLEPGTGRRRSAARGPKTAGDRDQRREREIGDELAPAHGRLLAHEGAC
jgi:hypothetical protein